MVHICHYIFLSGEILIINEYIIINIVNILKLIFFFKKNLINKVTVNVFLNKILNIENKKYIK